jgi:hypothetical protein
MTQKVKASNNTYIIYATRNTSQFDQTKQIMRCRILEAHRDHLLVESLKRYNVKKYAGAQKAVSGKYAGKPVRRINKDQALVIIDERSGLWLDWSTIRRREGSSRSPGRARGGR